MKEIDELQGLLNALRETSGTPPDFVDDLKDAAWDVLHEHPGADCRRWMECLIREYPNEIIDALGTEPEEINEQLNQWWVAMRYLDDVTGLHYTYREWSEVFVTAQSITDYDSLVKNILKKKIRE